MCRWVRPIRLSVDPATLGSGTIALGASLGLSGGLRAVQGTFASSYAAFDPATNQVWGVNSAGTALGSFISFGAQNMRDLFYVGVGRSQVGMLSDGGGTSSYSFATVSSTGAIGVVASAGMTSYFTTMHAGAAAHTGAYILGSDGRAHQDWPESQRLAVFLESSTRCPAW